MTPPLPVLHMGALHPFEQALTLMLAFGPFLLLGVVIWWRRRRDQDGSEQDHADVHNEPVPGSETRETH